MSDQLPKHVYLSFFGEIRPPATTSLRAHLCDFVAGGAKHVTIFFASPGGWPDDGIALFQFIKALPFEKITMHAIGMVASMAVPVFLCVPAKDRIVSKSARFLIHESTWNFQGDVTIAHMKEGVDHLGFSDDWTINVFKQETKLLEAVTDPVRLVREARFISSEEAVKLGIAGACAEAHIPSDAHLRIAGA